MRLESELSESDKKTIAEILDNRRSVRPRSDRLTPENKAMIDQLEEKLLKLAFLTDYPEKDRIAMLYIQHIAGVDPDSPNSLEDAAKRLNAVGPEPQYNGPQFYQSLTQLIPDYLTSEEVKWLNENDQEGRAAFHLLCDMEFNRPSQVVYDLTAKIHAWK